MAHTPVTVKMFLGVSKLSGNDRNIEILFKIKKLESSLAFDILNC